MNHTRELREIYTDERIIELEKKSRELEKMNLLMEEEMKERVQLEKDIKKKNQEMMESIKHLEVFNKEAEINATMETALSNMYSSIKDCKSLIEIADRGIKSISDFLQIPIGAIYILDEEMKKLNRVASFAFPKESKSFDHFTLGVGLVGQAALSKKQIQTEKGDFMPTIDLGIGKVRLDQMIHKPILYNEILVGVLEIGLIKKLEKTQLLWLDKAVNNLGIALKAAQDGEKLQKAFEKVAESQSLIQSVLDNSPALIYIKDLEGRYKMVNAPWCKVLNLSVEKTIGFTDKEIFQQEVAESFIKNDKLVIENNKVIIIEEEAPVNNTIHYYLSYKFPLINSEGEVYAICGISNDITERKEAEHKMKAVWNNSSDGYAWMDTNFSFIESNETFWKMMGCENESQLLGKTPIDFSPEFQPDNSISKEKALKMIHLADDLGKITFEWLHQKIDKTNFYTEITLLPLIIQGEKLTLVICHDITSQKEIQNAIIDSEKRMKDSLTAIGSHYWELDVQSLEINFTSNFLFKSFGFENDQTPKSLNDFINFIHEDDRNTVKISLEEHINKKTDLFESEFRFLTNNHEVRWMVSRGKIIEFNKKQGPTKIAGILIDVSDSKQAKQAIREGLILKEKMADVERFNRLAISRETRILELKKEINEIFISLGKDPLYNTFNEEGINENNSSVSIIDDEELKKEEQETLINLLSSKELNELFGNYCMSVGIPAAIIDLKGTVLASSNWQRACTDFHRANERTCERCIESDTDLATKLSEGKEYAIYNCKNGLTDCAAPIIVEGKHIANVFTGQFHLKLPNLAFFANQAEEFGFDKRDYLMAIQEVPIMDEKRLPEILGFLSKFARLVGKLSVEQTKSKRAEFILKKNLEVLKQERLAAMSLAEDANRSKQAENKIKREQKNLQSILDSSPICVGISVNGIIKYSNYKMSEIFGVVIGSTKAENLYVNPNERDRILAELQKSGRIDNLKTQFYGKDGSIKNVIINYNQTEFEGEAGILVWIVEM
jgi:PAS domain S-box-containing protein